MELDKLPKRASVTLLRKWVKMLRSGHYRQTNGQLCKGNGKIGYCCLGVLARAAGVPAKALGSMSYLTKWDGAQYATLFRLIPKRTQHTLGNMNDSQNKTFDQIGNYIERKIIPRFKKAA